MKNQLLTKKDIEFDNLNFWYLYISYVFRGFDDEKELNLDEAINELIDARRHIPFFEDWYKEFCPKNKADENGIFENPKRIAGKLTDDLSFAIEFHSSETTFFLNSKYIGNQGGHFEAWFLTLNELMALDKYEKLFLLFLPMVGVEESNVESVKSLVSEKLESISLFSEHSDYIAKCIVNGLIIDKPFHSIENIGTVNEENHSVRNIIKYSRYKKDVIELNKALKAFVE